MIMGLPILEKWRLIPCMERHNNGIYYIEGIFSGSHKRVKFKVSNINFENKIVEISTGDLFLLRNRYLNNVPILPNFFNFMRKKRFQ